MIHREKLMDSYWTLVKIVQHVFVIPLCFFVIFETHVWDIHEA